MERELLLDNAHYTQVRPVNLVQNNPREHVPGPPVGLRACGARTNGHDMVCACTIYKVEGLNYVSGVLQC